MGPQKFNNRQNNKLKIIHMYHDHIALGRAIVAAGRPLIYGGGNLGLMGTVASAYEIEIFDNLSLMWLEGAALENGGKVVGVLPYAMAAAGGERYSSFP